MSQRFSLLRLRPSTTAALVGLTLAVLASCSTAPDSQSSNPSPNRSIPSLEEAIPDVPSDAGESDGTSSIDTSEEAAEASEADEEATSQTDTVASDTPAGDIPLEDDSQFEEEQSETNTDSAGVNPVDSEPPETAVGSDFASVDGIAADVANSDDIRSFDSTDEVRTEAVGSLEDEEVSISNPSRSLETTLDEDATSDGHAEEEVGDRAWRLVQNRGRLRVGLDPTVGYTYLRANPERRTYEGFEWDILQAIAQELNVNLEPVYIPWNNQLAALESSSVDIVLGGRDELGVDETRFIPTIPYYSSPQRIVVREELSGEIQHLSDLFGQKVGTVADSAGAVVVEVFNQERANALTLLSSPNPSRLFEQLRQSEVDAIVIDQPVAVAEAELVAAAALEADDRTSDYEGSSSVTENPAASNAAEDSSSNASTPGVLTSGANSGHTFDIDPALDVTESSEVEPVVFLHSHSIEVAGEGRASSDAIRAEEPAVEETVNKSTTTEDTTSDVNLHIVGEPMFPTPLVGVVKAENASIKQAIDEAIATLEQNGTLTTILENWKL